MGIKLMVDMDKRYVVTLTETIVSQNTYTLRELIGFDPGLAAVAKADQNDVPDYIAQTREPYLEADLSDHFGEITSSQFTVQAAE